jgi:hypothetical protein
MIAARNAELEAVVALRTRELLAEKTAATSSSTTFPPRHRRRTHVLRPR